MTGATAFFGRTDTSVIGRWWWTVDRWMLLAVGALLAIGILLVMAAGPAAADRIGVDSFHFVSRQAAFLPLAAAVVLGVSLLNPLWVRRLAVVVFGGGLVLLAATPFVGAEINGATRWLALPGLSLQPSEFVKPAFAVTAAWMFAEARGGEGFPGVTVATCLTVVVAGLLLVQPDLGQTLLVVAVWGVQWFLAGLHMLLVVVLAVIGLGVLVGAYFTLDHVRDRVDGFITADPESNYQTRIAMEAFEAGGLFGVGPGEGRVKGLLPDSHTDFIFAVAGEEFGVLLCLLLVALFALLVLRAVGRMQGETNLFVLIAVGGLTTQFALQAIVNMGSSLSLMPPKGMTLPFISYGGSSLIGLALGMGMLLALTRRRPWGGIDT